MALLFGWLLVVASEAGTQIAYGWFFLFLLVFQAIAWVVALAGTFFWLGTIRVGTRRLGAQPPGIALLAIVAVLIGAGGAWFTNWGAIAPAPYLRLHRAQFDYVSSHPPTGHGINFGRGVKLPLSIRDISVDGHAYVDDEDQGLILVPQFYGIPEGANGFVHADSDAPGDRSLDFSGNQVKLADCDPLGDGWYYC